MKLILFQLLCCATIASSLASCVDVPSYPVYGGGYGPGYGGGYGSYGGGYNQGYNQGYHSRNNHPQQHRETHCYCSHKSCGCKPGHPKGGCYCDKGQHRH